MHARIADRGRLRKVSTRLVHEHQVIAVDALTVSDMVKNHRLARAISDASWRERRGMLKNILAAGPAES
ncbi:hypothetical protein GCM10012289_66830 [Nonomuraea cavernae]|uniref:Transposase n=1 Tax=Nonomuraea cavernae TaxID=2045107 RepID=A0A918DS97_9ACTN|nr:hypothetical protein GCM10012289_66830 [Nonomuraea cavernae]